MTPDEIAEDEARDRYWPKGKSKMTHNPADVQALIDAVVHYHNLPSHDAWKDVMVKQERLRPKPEMERVLPNEMPEWFISFMGKYGFSWTFEKVLRDVWRELVTLTMRPVQKQKWAMPDWDEIKTVDGNLYFKHPDGVDAISETSYESLRAKILSMSKETP
jgi:hypothetical protein